MIDLCVANLGRIVVVNNNGTRGKLIGFTDDGCTAYVDVTVKGRSPVWKSYAVYRLRWAGEGNYSQSKREMEKR
ncbi:MAG: hypothetical protein M3458_20795 [Acidobacteriota bacterium]|nr:hypothetical protein [Acidobacteriota bacterium]